MPTDTDPKGSTETKNERFIRLAEGRVNATLDKLRLLGQLANRRNYEYTDDQAAAIFQAIQKELNATKAKFRDGTSETKKFQF